MMKKILCAVLPLLLCIGLLAGCSEIPNYPVELGGATLEEKPQTVVGLSPYLNEILFGLEQSHKLVGRSEYCAFNGNVRALPSCGTVEQPDVARILELAPQVVLSAAELPKEADEALSAAGIAVCVLPVPADLYEVSLRVTQVATLLAGNNKAAKLAEAYLAKLNNELDYVRVKLQGVSRKTAVFILSQDGAVATGDTLIGDVMELCGLENVADGCTDYQMPLDDILAADPEVVVVCNPPSLEWLMISDFAALSQVSAGMAYEIDYEYVEQFAPSITNLLYGLAYAVHPDAMAAPDVVSDPEASYPTNPNISVPVTQG
ncbi:MAG: ABC transporter substrate-binding protein [Clostridia bacterium]|nr:ABC transporter substrate-binding protein [Clostridia bacterium]